MSNQDNNAPRDEPHGVRSIFYDVVVGIVLIGLAAFYTNTLAPPANPYFWFVAIPFAIVAFALFLTARPSRRRSLVAGIKRLLSMRVLSKQSRDALVSKGAEDLRKSQQRRASRSSWDPVRQGSLVATRLMTNVRRVESRSTGARVGELRPLPGDKWLVIYGQYDELGVAPSIAEGLQMLEARDQLEGTKYGG